MTDNDSPWWGQDKQEQIGAQQPEVQNNTPSYPRSQYVCLLYTSPSPRDRG